MFSDEVQFQPLGPTISARMAQKNWPTSMPKIYRPKTVVEAFQPPSGYDDPTHPPRPAPTSSPAPLPCVFEVLPYSDPFPRLKTLQQALRRHRLLFLWHASPRHTHVPDDLTPDKSALYEELEIPECGPGSTRSADTIFEYEAKIEAWLSEQQKALGTDPRGRPLRNISDDFPVAYFASWQFEHQVTPLQASYNEITRLVGVALREPRPAWIADKDLAIIRACEEIAGPQAADGAARATWNEIPIIRWDYPDRLKRHAGELDPLVRMEAGACPSPASGPTVPICPTPAIILRGQGEKPIVLGKEKAVLTKPQYTLVQALRDAGDDGLTKDQLERRCGGGARSTLERLRKSDPAWAKVLPMPRKAGVRYRILQTVPS